MVKKAAKMRVALVVTLLHLPRTKKTWRSTCITVIREECYQLYLPTKMLATQKLQRVFMSLSLSIRVSHQGN